MKRLSIFFILLLYLPFMLFAQRGTIFEKTYRVRSERRYRAVAGLSMGGGDTIFYALHHPEMFATAALLSASTGNWEFEQFKQRTKLFIQY